MEYAKRVLSFVFCLLSFIVFLLMLYLEALIGILLKIRCVISIYVCTYVFMRLEFKI